MVNIQDGKTITVPVGDGSIEYFYYELGDPAGEPVVFMHTGGAGVSAYQCWRLNLDAVAGGGLPRPRAGLARLWAHFAGQRSGGHGCVPRRPRH